MTKIKFKNYFKIFSILLFLFLNITLIGQGCSKYTFGLTSNEQSSSAVNSNLAEDHGNGHGYDGKLSFLNVQAGFTCEGKAAPKSILRHEVDNSWNLTVNETDKCAAINKSPVLDLVYFDHNSHVNYQNLDFHLDEFAPQTNDSLADYMTYLNIDPSTAQNAKDTVLGDSICADANGKCSLQAAIDEANYDQNKAFVLLLPNTNLSVSSVINITTSAQIIIRGAGLTQTIIDGSASTSGIFQVSSAISSRSVKLFEGFTLQFAKSNVAFNGSAMTVNGGSVTMSEVKIANGQSSPNVYAGPGTKDLLISKSLITGNLGHGVEVFGPSSVIIDHSLIENNTGNGFYVSNGTNGVSVRNSSIVNNQGHGVSFRKCYSGCEIINSTISGNLQSGFNLVNMDSFAADLFLRNSTVVSNAAISGANISVQMQPMQNSKLSIQNSIVALAAGGHPNCLVSLAVNFSIESIGSLTDDASCPGNGYILANPQLSALAQNGGNTLTMLPLAGSPVIDAGDLSVCTLTDQRDLPRPIDKLGAGAKCDIGAVELQ